MPKKDKPIRKEEKISETWLLPYADMLTLLLALFIVLFAMSEIDIKKFERLAYIFQTEFLGGAGVIEDGVSIVPEETPVDGLEDKEDDEEGKDESEVPESVEEYEKLLAIQEQLEKYIALNSLTDTLGTKLTGEGLLITVRTDVTFDSGSAHVKPEGVEIAKEIAKMLQTDPPHEIVVNGHTDDVPIYNEQFKSNWELSTMRAIQFLYLLLEYSDIEPKYFSARGYGEYKPIVPNTNEENRSKNRRVEVLILPNYDIEDEVEKHEET